VRVRLLDLGTVPYLESQTIYHAVAHAMEDDSPNTISLISPDRPYVCIGFHQELDKEIDLEYCRAHDIPVVRREVGGGAVYLDGNQLFVNFIFHRAHLPRQVEEIYKLFIRPLVETYRAIGIEASHRPLNDIVVGGRKIGGTGIAAIGQAMVVAGSLMFDFNTAAMARALKVSSEKMRDKIHQSLREYMTTIRRELGEPPPRGEVKAILVGKLAETLEVDIQPGELTVKERRTVRTLNRRFSSSRWLGQKSGVPRRGVTIKAGVRVAEAEDKAPGGLIRVTARLREGAIDDLSLSGDFTFHPAPLLGRLEAALRGRRLNFDELTAAIGAFYTSFDVQAPGVTPEDIARAVLKVEEELARS
jgi:lipoate-protein ligase A